MRIWHLDADVDNYDNFTTVKSNELCKFNFDGHSLIKEWVPIAVKEIEERKESDFPGLGTGSPIMSERALKVLKAIMGNSVEILKLRYIKGIYYAINVIDIIDCIDYEKAVYKKFSSSDRIMRFIKYSFRESCLEGKNIFKIVDEPTRRPFVSDVFRQKVLESKLEGFDFKLVWDSEAM